MDSKTVFLRADMNSEIATGHVMRCLSIADAITALGGHCIFISADENPGELVRSKGYELISLNTDWKHMEEETEVLLPLLKEYNVASLIIDTYQVTAGYMSAMTKSVHTYYVDDLDLFDYDVNDIICYAVYADDLYKERNRDKNILAGPEYTPLRKEFIGCAEKVISESIQNVLVMSGGTDTYGMIEKIVDKIVASQRKCKTVAICGRLYEGADLLRDKYHNYENIEIKNSVNNMKDWLEWADLVITAGGSTLYEICAVGTPAITFSFADNQYGNVKGFEKRNIMRYAGDARYDDVAENINKLIDEYASVAVRKDLSVKEQELVDGKGAERIAKIILND